MTSRLPQTREELSQVYGVGAAKLEKYGGIFLEMNGARLKIRFNSSEIFGFITLPEKNGPAQ
jgi:hypothetical protein